MLLRRSLKRAVALVVLGGLAFAQASVVLAACQMERGDLAHMFSAGEESSECADSMAASTPGDSLNGCVAHCTSDLQAVGGFAIIIHAPALQILALPRSEFESGFASGPAGPPPARVPPRILLHSFLS